MEANEEWSTLDRGALVHFGDGYLLGPMRTRVLPLPFIEGYPLVLPVNGDCHDCTCVVGSAWWPSHKEQKSEHSLDDGVSV